jgi:23S rRNA pseudouridine2605 synthase
MKKHASERIQKVLANNGYGSRRKIEEYLNSGRITVDGIIAKLGDRMNLEQKVKLDGKLLYLNKEQQTQVIIYNKPIGEICSTKDPKHNKTVFDNLPKLDNNGRWVMVGRLDINSQGLLIFTNNGDFANKLMHPGSKIPRIYKIRASGSLTKEQLEILANGIILEDGKAKFDSIKLVRSLNTNCWYKIVISSGKNRIIRRMLASQNLSVNKLIRISYGNISLPFNLKPGAFKYIDYNKVSL